MSFKIDRNLMKRIEEVRETTAANRPDDYPVPDELALMVAAARRVAIQAHRGQLDKAGEDYFRAHVLDVVTRVGHDPVLRTIAYLHDVVEDTDVPLSRLRWDGFPDQVVTAVDAITHRDNEPRDDYYARVKRNPLALKVKLADIASNTDPARMAALDEETRGRLISKYDYALEVLAPTEWRVCMLPDCGCDGTWHA